MGRKRKQTILANIASQVHYYNALSELYVGTKEIVGLPDTCDTPFIMREFRDKGKCVFVKDPNLGILSLSIGEESAWTPYGRPVEGIAIDYFGKTYPFNAENGAVVYATYGFTTKEFIVPAQTIDFFSRFLATIDRTIKTNVHAMRTPVLLQADSDKQLESLKALFEEYDGLMPFIFADKKLTELNKISALNLNTPDFTKTLWDLKTNVTNEVLEYLGIPTTSTLSRERVNTAEIITNNASAIAFRQSPLKAIQQGLDRANKIFGTDMRIQFTDMSASLLDGLNTEQPGVIVEEEEKGEIDNE